MAHIVQNFLNWPIRRPATSVKTYKVATNALGTKPLNLNWMICFSNFPCSNSHKRLRNVTDCKIDLLIFDVIFKIQIFYKLY